MNSSALHRHCFSSMGSEVEILLLGGTMQDAGDAFALAESLGGKWMRTFSRFHASSELSQLNSTGGGLVSRRLFEGIQRAIEAARASHGAFNPLVLPALIAAGYDRSFEHGPAHRPRPYQSESVISPDRIMLDAARQRVQLPRRAQLDLGGIAKGLYADELAQRLLNWPGGIVSAGGDMRVWGEGPDNGAWAIGVEPPDRSEGDAAIVLLNDGGVATSGVNRRSWKVNSIGRHHLIDPWSGLPVVSEVASVTVVAPTAAIAETTATSLFIDPDLAKDSALSSVIWGVISVDSLGKSSCTRFDLEAPFHVFLNS
jgi:thiamine biosynthesis lipoprotein